MFKLCEVEVEAIGLLFVEGIMIIRAESVIEQLGWSRIIYN